MYRGPFVYRKSSGSSSLTLESAAFGGGRLTPSGAMLYVTDYLGSVRAVVNGGTGAIYKASDFSAFGAESDVASVQKISAPLGTTFRDAYTGKEDQHPDFGTGYTDFGARQYSPALRRWMTTDPLSEKYYGISPYAFCNNNPVNFVDPDGSYIAEKKHTVVESK
jgi:RHS repeat-associated protein